MINYDSVIEQLVEAGLILDGAPVADGMVRRCKTTEDRERRGWYCLHEWQSARGNRYIVGSYGVWHGNDNGARKIELGKDQQISKEEQAALRKRIAEDKKKAKAARASRNKKAAMRAASTWRKLLTAPPSGVDVDYLQRKGVQAHGVRYTESGAIAVPMMDAQHGVHGLQFILPSHHERRKKTGRDKEYWPTGLAKQGHYYLIGSPSAGGVILVAEGYATAATLYEETGLPVVVAFDANNILPVVQALAKFYKGCRILICGDDDYIQKCRSCQKMTTVETDDCIHCGAPHGKRNAGVLAASAAALEVNGSWVIPQFPTDRAGKKLTDFNDLQQHQDATPHLVKQQIQDKIDQLGWKAQPDGGVAPTEGGGEAGSMPSRLTVDEAARRYWGTYGLGGDVLFDQVERRLVHKKDVINLLPRHGWDDLKDHPGWRVALDSEIGFDPTEKDPAIKCNLFGGWPTDPKAGKCTSLLELLEYLCNNEENGNELYQWVLRWLAYPLQHRGAKMHSAIVVHGPQGTGKSRFFEAIVKIYGEYGRVLGQEALEDKFNADWSEKKLFILADEVLARQDMYHVKNRLKGFITGDTIRVNPKNIAAHTEKNQMNIVFLSNEHMPTVLENDDRRHCVIWVPPKLPDEFFAEVNEEVDNGGVEALFDYLLKLDLGDFKPWTKPPMTSAKQDLINLGVSSNERFIQEWMSLELENDDGQAIPFCPCQGSQLFKLYERWCKFNGETRPRPSNHFIGHLSKLHGWTAGKSERTYRDLRPDTLSAGDFKNRKMVVPSAQAMNEALRVAGTGSKQDELIQKPDEPKNRWLTRCYFAFESALGWHE